VAGDVVEEFEVVDVHGRGDLRFEMGAGWRGTG
jgi:hypothetical protein